MCRKTTRLPTGAVNARRFGGGSPIDMEVHAVLTRPGAHYTRAWTACQDSVSVGFRICVLPIRLLALGILWCTSSPRRLVLTGVLVLIGIAAAT
jgi:hypothetical protein